MLGYTVVYTRKQISCDELDEYNPCHLLQLHTWNPTIQNPYVGQVMWAVPENVEIQVTLFRDSRHSEYEDKEWTFVIEDVSDSSLS